MYVINTAPKRPAMLPVSKMSHHARDKEGSKGLRVCAQLVRR